MFTLFVQDAGTDNLVEVDQFKTEAEAVFDADSLAGNFEATEADADHDEARAELDVDGRLVLARWLTDAEGGRSLVAVFEQ